MSGGFLGSLVGDLLGGTLRAILGGRGGRGGILGRGAVAALRRVLGNETLLAVLSADYMTAPVKEIGKIRSVLTMVGGEAVYAGAPFAKLAPAEAH